MALARSGARDNFSLAHGVGEERVALSKSKRAREQESTIDAKAYHQGPKRARGPDDEEPSLGARLGPVALLVLITRSGERE